MWPLMILWTEQRFVWKHDVTTFLHPDLPLKMPLKKLLSVMPHQNSRNYDCRPDSPYCCKCRHEMFVETPVCLANNLIFRFKTRDVAVRYIKAMRVRCLSSLLLVKTDHWDPAWSSSWTFTTHRFCTLRTTHEISTYESRYTAIR